MKSTDRIEKRVTLRAPVERVWRALTDAREFGRWFGFVIAGQFAPGKAMSGTFNGKLDEAALMEQQKQLGLRPSKVNTGALDRSFFTVDRIEPQHTFSFRWIPYGIDAEADLANEPMTLVEFHLEPVAEGTLLTIVESGFDRVPAHRRERAFRMNEGGWTGQIENVRRHVEGS